MANDTDTTVEDQPSADLSGSQPALPFDPRVAQAVPPIQAQGPPAGATPAQPTAGGGALSGTINTIMTGLQNSLTQAATQMPAGAQVQQRHGGLLTGLAGVLLDGLASGMAPDARTATMMPMIRQQQMLQQQQLQLQQQKMQEEMRQAPMREAMQWAQTLVTMQGLRHAMARESADNQLHIND